MTAFHHRRGGAGEPLVLIHGIGHHWRAWAPVLPALDREFDVLAVDSPGFGRSSPLPAGTPPTITAYASAFAHWFTELGLDRPHVVGNSMGGGIAIELARRGLVRSATALSPVGFWSPSERRYCQGSLGLVAAMPGRLRPAVRASVRTDVGRRILLAQLLARPGQLDGEAAEQSLDALWDAPSFDRCLAGFTEYQCAPFATALDVPLTIVWGQHDRLLPARLQSRRARRVLWHAAHTTIDAGHLPCSDAPGPVVDQILRTADQASSSKRRPSASAPRPTERVAGRLDLAPSARSQDQGSGPASFGGRSVADSRVSVAEGWWVGESQ